MQAEHGDTEYKNSPRIRIQGECNRTIRLWLYGVQNIRFTVRKSVDGAKWRIPLSEHVFFNSEKRHINCVNMYEMPRQLMAGPVCVCSYVLCICPAIVNWRRVPLSMSVCVVPLAKLTTSSPCARCLCGVCADCVVRRLSHFSRALLLDIGWLANEVDKAQHSLAGPCVSYIFCTSRRCFHCVRVRQNICLVAWIVVGVAGNSNYQRWILMGLLISDVSKPKAGQIMSVSVRFECFVVYTKRDVRVLLCKILWQLIHNRCCWWPMVNDVESLRVQCTHCTQTYIACRLTRKWAKKPIKRKRLEKQQRIVLRNNCRSRSSSTNRASS